MTKSANELAEERGQGMIAHSQRQDTNDRYKRPWQSKPQPEGVSRYSITCAG